MRLPPPTSPLPETPISQSQSTRDRDAEDDMTGGRIDVRVPSVAESFIEPLDTLLQVDEISNARAHFEDIVGDVTRAVLSTSTSNDHNVTKGRMALAVLAST
ncbi:hypothetical protein TNCV_4585691 [Trichonephila clavipes]|nr:hypothetical protein TNCV_4585691 [Trichonephila clavipes]